MNHILRLFALACLVLASGCVMTGQTVELSPLIRTGGGDLGRGREVAVTVVDAVSAKSLGSRDPVLGRLTSITVEPGLSGRVGKAVVKGLAEQGFKPAPLGVDETPAEEPMRRLTVTVESLKYVADLSGVPKKVVCSAVVKAEAVNNASHLERTFNLENERQVVLEPSEADNEKYLADTLSEALTNALTDYELLSFLAKEILRTKKIGAS